MKGSYVGLIIIVFLIAGAGYYTFSKTYADRMADAPAMQDGTSSTSAASDGLSTYTFNDKGNLLRFRYPDDFTVSSGGSLGYSTAWQSGATTSGLVLVTAVLPRSFEPGTNFSEGTFTIGTSAEADAIAACDAPVAPAEGKSTVTLRDVPFTRLVTADAGAGNRYETTSYRTVRNGQCYTVEYTIHSTNLGNYDPSQGIVEFDKERVTTALEALVQSVTFL